MITRVGNYGHSFKGVSAYLSHDKGTRQTSERVDWIHTINLNVRDDHAPSEKAEKASKIMAFTASNAGMLKQQAGVPNTGNKAEAGPVYHFMLSWHKDDDPSEEQMRGAGVSVLQHMGFYERHQAYMTAHNDEQQKHLHLVVNLVSWVDGRRANTYRDHLSLSKWAQAHEEQFGLVRVEERILNNARRDQGEFVKYKAHDIAELYYRSDNTKAFVAALEEKGLTLAQGHKRDYMIVDGRGESKTLSSYLKGVKVAELRERLGDKSVLPHANELEAERRAAWTQRREEEKQTRKEHFNEKASEMKKQADTSTEGVKHKAEQAEIWNREDYHVEQNRRDNETRPERLTQDKPIQAERKEAGAAERKKTDYQTWLDGAKKASAEKLKRQDDKKLDRVGLFEQGKQSALFNIQEAFSTFFSDTSVENQEHSYRSWLSDGVGKFEQRLEGAEGKPLNWKGIHDQGQHSAYLNAREAFDFYYPAQEPTQSNVKSQDQERVEKTRSEAEKRREVNEVEETGTKGKVIIAPYQKAGEREDIGKDSSGRDLRMDEVRAKEEARRAEEERLFREAAAITDPEKRRAFIREGMLAHFAKENVPGMIKNTAERQADAVIKNRDNPYLLTPEQKAAIKQRDEAREKSEYWKGIRPYDDKHLHDLDRRQALEREEAQQLGKQEETLRKYYGLAEHEARIKDLTEQYNKASGRKAQQLAEELEAERKTYDHSKNLIAYQQEKLKQQQVEKRPDWAKETMLEKTKEPENKIYSPLESIRREEQKQTKAVNAEDTQSRRFEERRPQPQADQANDHKQSETSDHHKEAKPLDERERNIDAENAEHIRQRLHGDHDQEIGYEP